MANLPTTFNHHDFEADIYNRWEESGAFKPSKSDKKSFSILMPPPNANASLHAGHAMYTIQDILVRFKRMQGHPTAWFPGTDHAGFETQYVYEKQLKKEGKSRFQFDRETLYTDIADFVSQNSNLIIEQMKRLGFSADWSQSTFTLDEKVVSIVMDTFTKLERDGLIYRDNYLVNYCPKCGTTFADLEISHKETQSPLYFVRYRFSDGEPRTISGKEQNYITVATVRPETIFADTAVAINPADPRAAQLEGEYVLNPLTNQPIPIILDDYVDPEFGTGLLKITPAHDPNDFKIGKKHELSMITTINSMGKIDLSWLSPDQDPQLTRAQEIKPQFHGVSTSIARDSVVKLLQAENSLEKTQDNYTNSLAVCYKGGHPIEPLPHPNWFLQMKELAQLGLEAVDSGETTIIPSRFNKTYRDWLENIRDWPISRQIVWGIRLPVWYNAELNKNIYVSFLDKRKQRHNLEVGQALEAGFTLEEIKLGLQTLTAPVEAEYVVSVESPGDEFIQETDTFDTWFSSGQWPLVVLDYPDGPNFKQFYPTSVMDTMWDILFFWVARMIMLGKYLTKSEQNPDGISPFSTVYLHSMVTDEKGAKMSKSRGNVINPIDIIDKYGADALRISLVAGSAPGNPIALSEAKVKGYRNFGNKIWNIGRFISLQEEELGRIESDSSGLALTDQDQKILNKADDLIKQTTDYLDKLRFSDAALGLYDFIWNDFANSYLENNKGRTDKQVYIAVVKSIYLTCIRLLHPFMPFVTEAIWKQLQPDESMLITSSWPN